MKTLTDEQRKEQLRKVLRVKRTPLGLGVFALQAFGTDAVVGEITGRIKGTDYVSDYCMDMDGKAHLDPVWPFRYLNHSCEPNCQLLLWKFQKHEGKRIHRLWLNTLRPIEEGEQLTIDYAWPADAAIRCKCGSANCRGWIVDVDELHKKQRKKKAKVAVTES